MPREATVVSFPKDLMAEIKAMRDDQEMKWSEIAEAQEISTGKAILIYTFATVKPSEKIKDPTPAVIKKARNVEGLSWGVLMARTGMTEGALRSMFAEAGEEPRGHRIGKGGRYPGDDNPNGDGETKPKKKVAAKKAAAKKADPTSQPLKGLKSQEIKDAITGYALKYGDQEEVITVQSVKTANASKIVLTTGEGKGRTLKTSEVREVSKKKVL